MPVKQDEVIQGEPNSNSIKKDFTFDTFLKDKQNKLNKAKEYIVNKKDKTKEYIKSEEAGKKAAETFEKGVVISKFSMLGALLALSFVNADATFIAKSPRNFLAESIAVGASAMIPTIFIGKNRGANNNTILNGCFIAFLVFFIFHILMEMSGVNGIETRELNLEDSKQQDLLENISHSSYITPLYIFMVFIFIIMTILAVRVGDINIFKTKIGWLEMSAFGAINAAPAYLINKDRGMETKDALKSAVKVAGVYSTLYAGLQTGGFFSHIFKPEVNIIDKNKIMPFIGPSIGSNYHLKLL